MLDRPKTGVLENLNSQGRKLSSLPHEFMQQVQSFEKVIEEEIRANDEQGGVIAAIQNSFLMVQILATAHSLDKKFLPLKKCIDDIVNRFGHDESFQDDILLFSWIYFNFPTTLGGKPIGYEIAQDRPELKPFLDAALDSRLGIFEITKISTEECHLRELFTGKQWKLNHGLDLRGDTMDRCLVIARPMHAFGEQYIFGDYFVFPSARRSAIEGSIREKMKTSFFHEDDVVSYETFMSLGAPYWFTIFAKNDKCGVLAADHYLQYYKK